MKDISCWEEKFQNCVYSDKLINLISHLNTQVIEQVKVTEVKRAVYYARKYHATQVRQSGEPYYSHPIEVACMVAEYTAAHAPKLYNTDMIIISLLHDTMEDTELTEEMISVIFGQNIATQVEALTRIKSHGKISSAEMLALLHRGKNDTALLIKAFDRLHNLQTIGVKPHAKIQKIVQETIAYFVTLSGYLEIYPLESKFLQLCSAAKQKNEDLISEDSRPLSLAFQNALY